MNRRRKNHVEALFSQLGFDEVGGYGREQIEKDYRYTTSLRLSSYAENYWKAHPTTPIPLSFTRSPTFTGRHAHLCDTDEAKAEDIW